MRITSNCLALLVRSKFYLRQVISISCGVAIGVVLSLLLAPFLDQMCSVRTYPKPKSQQADDSAALRMAMAKSVHNRKLHFNETKRPHFLSHELGIRNKLLSVTIMSSHNDLPLIQSLYDNLNHASESSTVPFNVISILAGQLSLISSIEQEIKVNMSNFLTMRLADSQIPDGELDRQRRDAINEDTAYMQHLTALVMETLFKVSQQYRSQFDWFVFAFPQVYIRFPKLFKKILTMSPVYQRLLMVPLAESSGYGCQSSPGRLPFRSVLLSNKLMNDIFKMFETECPKDNSQRFTSLECLGEVFKQACIDTHAHTREHYMVSNFPLDQSQMLSIAKSWAVFPASSQQDYRMLDKLFLEDDYNTSVVELEHVRRQLADLVVHLPPGENIPSWPIDVQPPLKPKNRFDIAPWKFLNATHIFFTDEYTTVMPLAGPDLEDVQGVTASARTFIDKKYPRRFKFVSLESGFSNFDPVRGMEYLLYLLFEDKFNKNNRILKCMQVLKPLNRLESVNAPHVTEDAVVTLVVPVFVEDGDDAEGTGIAFLDQVLALLKAGDRLKLWLLLVYPSSTTAVDPLMKLKAQVADAESQFPGRLAWLSVQTTQRSSLHLFEAVVRSRQNSAKPPDDDWLVLTLPSESQLSREFLNRVRLMAIRKYQVYFPIAFSQYHPSLIAEPLLLSAINGASSPQSAATDNQGRSGIVELTSRDGHFDQYDFDTAAFYLSDYADCRHEIDPAGEQKPVDDIADVFLACTRLHVFRAVDPGLKRLYQQSAASCDAYATSEEAREECRIRLEIGLGNRKHMAAKLSEHMQSEGVAEAGAPHGN